MTRPRSCLSPSIRHYPSIQSRGAKTGNPPDLRGPSTLSPDPPLGEMGRLGGRCSQVNQGAGAPHAPLGRGVRGLSVREGINLGFTPAKREVARIAQRMRIVSLLVAVAQGSFWKKGETPSCNGVHTGFGVTSFSVSFSVRQALSFDTNIKGVKGKLKSAILEQRSF